MCSIDIEARAYLYREFPKYYVWNPKGKTWTKRKTRSVIGRIAIGIYDIPQLDHKMLEGCPSECREINEELSVQIPSKDFDAQSQLDPEQEQAFTKIVQTIDTRTTGIFFVDGPGGTGKIYLYRALLANIRSKGVVPKSTRVEIVNASLVKSYLRPLMEKIQFTRNMRERTDPTFSEFLLRVGYRDEPIIRDNLILLPKQLTIKHCRDEIPEESIIKEICPNLQENATRSTYVTKRAILASRNDHVDNLNDRLISMFPGESKTFNSFDSAKDDTNTITKKNI
ncbi:hypothetical protein H5410_002289 [Solanum commersonii]|uniref:ATP-dependent DNA helicase n=1 Tax=Solanum commersonii TaxID=4109 RepID=A0A9J6B1P2_SOLCO|nr:hypothetical protein H5410_002289 [Solanum commersonii]